jgi:hypothetical protein
MQDFHKSLAQRYLVARRGEVVAHHAIKTRQIATMLARPIDAETYIEQNRRPSPDLTPLLTG